MHLFLLIRGISGGDGREKKQWGSGRDARERSVASGAGFAFRTA